MSLPAPRKHHERRRARRRAVTIAMPRVNKRSLLAGALSYPTPAAPRPTTRGDCGDHPRPCGFVSCKHNLYLDVNPETGAIKLNFPDIEVDEMIQSCALDVADQGALTLDIVGQLMNVTHERVRQVETKALIALRDRLPDAGIETPYIPTDTGDNYE